MFSGLKLHLNFYLKFIITHQRILIVAAVGGKARVPGYADALPLELIFLKL